jgi:hypothetical protein
MPSDPTDVAIFELPGTSLLGISISCEQQPLLLLQEHGSPNLFL